MFTHKYLQKKKKCFYMKLSSEQIIEIKNAFFFYLFLVKNIINIL